jgi:hypothetical protein
MNACAELIAGTSSPAVCQDLAQGSGAASPTAAVIRCRVPGVEGVWW